MIPRLFLDTNVLLDFILRREGWEGVARIIDLSQKQVVRSYCSYISMADIAYIAGRHASPEKVRTIIKETSSWCEVLAPSSMDIYNAVRIDHPDFEDSLQILLAEANRCSAIITSNVRHFEGYTEIPVYTVSQIIEL